MGSSALFAMVLFSSPTFAASSSLAVRLSSEGGAVVSIWICAVCLRRWVCGFSGLGIRLLGGVYLVQVICCIVLLMKISLACSEVLGRIVLLRALRQLWLRGGDRFGRVPRRFGSRFVMVASSCLWLWRRVTVGFQMLRRLGATAGRL